MKVINTQAGPFYCSYAKNLGGCTLLSGQETPELPLDRIHLPLMWKDLDAGRIAIRLSAEDKKFIKRVLDEAEKKIVVATKKSKPPKAVKPKAPKSQPIPPLVNKPVTPGMPDWSDKEKAAKAEVAALTHTPGSLADIVAQNEASEARKKAEAASQLLRGPMANAARK